MILVKVKWYVNVENHFHTFTRHYEKIVKIKSFLTKAIMSRANHSLQLLKCCNLIKKIKFFIKLVANFGLSTKITKK